MDGGMNWMGGVCVFVKYILAVFGRCLSDIIMGIDERGDLSWLGGKTRND